MSPNGGPPDHWVKFPVQDISSDEVLTKLDSLADQGFSSAAVVVACTDGIYCFVGGYKK